MSDLIERIEDVLQESTDLAIHRAKKIVADKDAEIERLQAENERLTIARDTLVAAIKLAGERVNVLQKAFDAAVIQQEVNPRGTVPALSYAIARAKEDADAG